MGGFGEERGRSSNDIKTVFMYEIPQNNKNYTKIKVKIIKNKIMKC